MSELTPMQRAVARTFFGVMDHGHGSPEAQEGAKEFMEAFDAAHPEFKDVKESQ
jgi:hypothetical protein